MLGVGTDILNIQRIRNIFSDVSDPFFKATYTDAERDQALIRPDPVLYFATRFAGKEAVFKCLGIMPAGIRLNEIEILEAETGQPRVTLFGNLKQIAENKGIRDIQVSLSYETDFAIAFAVAQNKKSEE
jgi:phosphopantetheine--protein transferase-like protein